MAGLVETFIDYDRERKEIVVTVWDDDYRVDSRYQAGLSCPEMDELVAAEARMKLDRIRNGETHLLTRV